MGHEDDEIGHRYSKLKQGMAFRQAVAKKIGLGRASSISPLKWTEVGPKLPENKLRTKP